MRELLKEFEVSERKVKIENEEYPYIDAKYMYRNNLFFRCFIFDFVSVEKYEEYALEWIDFDKFLNFERFLLEDEFFLAVYSSQTA